MKKIHSILWASFAFLGFLCLVNPALCTDLGEITISPSDYEAFSFTAGENEEIYFEWDERDGNSAKIYLLTADQYASYPSVSNYLSVEYGSDGHDTYTKPHTTGTFYLVVENNYGGYTYLHVTLSYRVGEEFSWGLVIGLLVILVPSAIIIYYIIKSKGRVTVSETTQGLEFRYN